MADLETRLSWLGMSQYYESFVDVGFDSWETLLEITEEDLESLGVELGHRRKLQREISSARREAHVPAVVSPSDQTTSGPGTRSSASQDDLPKQDSRPFPTGKRGYRHHPKPDGNAPQRPYSAYVMFSNWVREQTKEESLPFAEISRQVGDRWQKLSPEEKDAWKEKAAVPWNKYKQELSEYQKTENYRKYNQYVTEFNATQASKRNAAKSGGKSNTLSTTTHKGKPDQAYLQKAPGSVSAGFPLTNSVPSFDIPSQGPWSSIIASHGEPREPPRSETSLPIPRISWSKGRNSAADSSGNTRPPRVNQACEPCRQRKSKCDGQRPMCSHCHTLSIECYYQNGKKDKGKKLIEMLWSKLSTYEDLLLRIGPELDNVQKTEVQHALLSPPQLQHAEESLFRLSRNEAGESHGSDIDGESVASGVGSMGSTDHVNEDDFGNPSIGETDHTFSGPASDMTWMQKLSFELTKRPEKETKITTTNPSAQAPWTRSRAAAPASDGSGQLFDDADLPALENQVDPYEMPVSSTADALLEVYFSTVHPSFPIFDEDSLLDAYSQSSGTPQSQPSASPNLITKLQIVFAIAAVHAHLTEAKWVGDHRDHILYLARARLKSGGTGFLNETIDLDQVQISGLASMYFLATSQVNRAWKCIGLAVRSAQGLGMHLENVTPNMSEVDKMQRMRIWFCVSTMDRILATVTGRPSMVKEQDCSASFPLPPPTTDDAHLRDAPSSSQAYTSVGRRRHSGSTQSSKLSHSSLESGLETPNSSVVAKYFFYIVELHKLSQKVLEGLYAPNIRRLKWAEIQRRIIRLDEQLSRWIAALPTFLDPDAHSSDDRIEPFRVALAIISHSVRAIINRPCLCRINRRIAHQSNESLEDNREAANRCVSSAQAVLNLLPTRPDLHPVSRSPIWWMLLHHIKRAATVLLLELSYRAEHMPSDAEGVLADAKKAINWLRFLANTSKAAYQSWLALSDLLRRAAVRVGGTTDDIITTPPEGQYPVGMQSFGALETSTYRVPPYEFNFDPTFWEPMDFFQYGGLPDVRNTYMGGQDRSGFYQQEAQQDLYPPANEMSHMATEQEQQQGGQSSFQAPNAGMWFGFDPRG